MLQFTARITYIVILISVSLGDSRPADTSETHCQFGKKPRSFDVIQTSDCSCNNYNVQFKLNQIAQQYLYQVDSLSANRKDHALREQSRTQFVNFAQTFFDEHLFYHTAVTPGGREWNSLSEFLFDGNDDNPSFTDLILDLKTTLITNTHQGIITDCSLNGNTETITLKVLFSAYLRPNDPLKTYAIQRTSATYEFTRSTTDNIYLLKRMMFKGIIFPIENAARDATALFEGTNIDSETHSYTHGTRDTTSIATNFSKSAIVGALLAVFGFLIVDAILIYLVVLQKNQTN